MRKHLLLVCLVVFCYSGLFAQEGLDDRPYRIAIGPKAGVGVAMGTPSDVQNLTFAPSLSYQFGFAVNSHFGRRFELSEGGTGWVGVQLEAMYGKHAIKLGPDGLGVSCIEVPVLAQLYVVPSFAIEAGATAVKYLSGSPAQLSHDGVTYGLADLKGGDMMVTAGVCYKTQFGLMVDARYNLGLSPLAGNFDTKVSTIMVSLAYLINIVK